jgi:hypothetical protein
MAATGVVELRIPARRLASWILLGGLASAATLLALDVITGSGRPVDIDAIARLADLDGEPSLAGWLARTETLTLALLLGLLAFGAREHRGRFALLALAVSGAALYEGALLHGRLLDVAAAIRGGVVTVGGALDWLARPLGPLPGAAWQVLGSALALACAVGAFVFLWRELDETPARTALVAAAVAAAVAVASWLAPPAAWGERASEGGVLAGLVARAFAGLALLRALPREVGELRLRSER